MSEPIIKRRFISCPECKNVFGMESLSPDYSDLLAKHERVLEMLRIAESALIGVKKHTLHPQAPSVWNDYLQDLVDKPLQEIERLKNG